jgi:hypothetical protein
MEIPEVSGGGRKGGRGTAGHLRDLLIADAGPPGWDLQGRRVGWVGGDDSGGEFPLASAHTNGEGSPAPR